MRPPALPGVAMALAKSPNTQRVAPRLCIFPSGHGDGGGLAAGARWSKPAGSPLPDAGWAGVTSAHISLRLSLGVGHTSACQKGRGPLSGIREAMISAMKTLDHLSSG